MSDDHIFSTEISFESRTLSLPSEDITPTSHNALVSSNKYGLLFVVMSTTLYILDIPELEISKEFKAQEVVPLPEAMLGITISFDELKLLCYSQHNIYVFDIPTIVSKNSSKECQRRFPHGLSLLLCKISKHLSYDIVYMDEQFNVHTRVNSLGTSPESYSKQFKGCMDIDWSPYSNSLALVQHTSIVILSRELTQLYSIQEYSIDTVSHFNFIHWASSSSLQCDYLLLGCQCIIPSESEDEDDELFVSLVALLIENNTKVTQLSYFEDVCQDMKLIDLPQKFLLASMPET